MKFFKQREPRRFNHKYIFVDERKEKLNRIEENAKRELGLLPPSEESYRDRLKGAFVNKDSHLARRRENGPRMSSRFIVGALLVCFFILFYLLKSMQVI